MKILFVNHWALRTGAPIVLLHFLRWLKKEEPSIQFDVLSLKTGDLLEEFTEISNQHYYSNRRGFLEKLTAKFKRELSFDKNLRFPTRLLDKIAKNQYDLIYCNTVVSVPEAVYLKKRSSISPKLLVHFHELNLTIQNYCPQLTNYLKDIDYSIAASGKVKKNLLTNWGFLEKNVEVVYAYSTVPKVDLKASDCFIVGGSGLVHWRKGPDFFLLVAAYVINRLPEAPIKFQWVGKISKLDRFIYEEDIRKLGLDGKIEFTGKKELPFEYYSNFDVFLMTSKEDPFPLVCIEVGMLGKPIICFEDATGTEEVLNAIDGAVVPYMDIKEMGNSVITYYNDSVKKAEDGKAVKSLFEGFTPSNQGCKILKTIKTIISLKNA